MSRSNQVDLINPVVRWMEWNGEKGCIKFYDKDLEQKVELDGKITFIFLDQLAAIKGWNDASDSGIYSNEIKDSTKEQFIVKCFNGGEIARGFYKDIRDRIASNGGHFTASIYIAIKIGDALSIANLQLKGASLNAWIEFLKKNRKEIYKSAVAITGVVEGIKGRVKFLTPIFAIKELSEETNKQAITLDVELQEYLKGYLAKNTSEQPEVTSTDQPKPEPTPPSTNIDTSTDDLPF